MKAVPLGKGGEDLLGGNGAELDALVGHGFEAAFEFGCAIGQGRGRAVGPRGPREGLVEVRVVVFDGLGEVDIASEVRALVPLAQQTCEEAIRVLERDENKLRNENGRERGVYVRG